MRRDRRPTGDATADAPRSRLRTGDALALGVAGLQGRPLRAALSAAGIALGVATMVAVLGISSSSRAQLVAQIDALGTNLLTVAPSQTFSDQPATLPKQSPSMVRRIGPVLAASAIGDVGANIDVYRNDRVSAADTNAISVYTAQPSLLATVEGHLARGRFLNAATVHFPAVVLGANAASALGVDRADGTVSVWLGHRWFSVVGVLDPVPLAPELDRSALVGAPIAERELRADGSPVELYVRTDPTSVPGVESVLGATAEPSAPQNVTITNPTDALVARADATTTFNGLLVALGAVALLVGGVGIANVMVIAVLERRGEIGLRRALGATKIHVGAQFVSEAAVLAAIGGLAGAVAGSGATTVYASARNWSAVIPPGALGLAALAAVAVGIVAGLYPALRAARLAPSDALRSA